MSAPPTWRAREVVVDVRVEDRGPARYITLARPPLNVLDGAMIASLHAALAELTARRDVKAVVLRSAIDGAFSAGVDVADHAPDRAPATLEAFHDVVRLIEALPQPLLAAVDGACLGGGCELAACCDVVVATARSRFGQPEIDVGCFPPVACVLLPRIVGRAAYELILGGAAIPAAEAARIGLINTAVPADRLDDEVAAAVDDLLSGGPGALAASKRLLAEVPGMPVDEAFSWTGALSEELFAGDEARAGMRAYLEKRPAPWVAASPDGDVPDQGG
jgi:cyclohexa-1,5-dienecarbonyl-CoA hydratase